MPGPHCAGPERPVWGLGVSLGVKWEVMEGGGQEEERHDPAGVSEGSSDLSSGNRPCGELAGRSRMILLGVEGGLGQWWCGWKGGGRQADLGPTGKTEPQRLAYKLTGL